MQLANWPDTSMGSPRDAAMEGRIGARSATGQESRVHNVNVNGVKRLEEWALQGIGTANFHRKQKLFDSSGWNFIFSLKTTRIDHPPHCSQPRLK